VKSAHGASLSQAQATPGMDIPTRAFRHDLTNSDARMTSPLVQLLRSVAATGYRFTTTTPLTHRRVLGRRGNRVGTTLRDIFGWNLPFVEGSIAPTLLATMDRAGVLIPYGEMLRCNIRISTLDDDFFLHSAYPTNQDAAVFLGPDTYRFARFIQHALQVSACANACTPAHNGHATVRILDVGCGSGAGGIVASRQLVRRGTPPVVTMSDINPLALRYTAVNAEVAGIPVILAPGDGMAAVTGDFDLIISNPPYLDDATQRIYRHGGDRLGRALSARIATEALARLAPGGTLLLYTGVAIIDGIDPFLAELLTILDTRGYDWSYGEIDPDVFGEELDRPVYAQADRIAAVGLIATRKSQTS